MKTKNKKPPVGNFKDPATGDVATDTAKSQAPAKAEGTVDYKHRFLVATGAKNEVLSHSLMNDAFGLIISSSETEKAEKDLVFAQDCLDLVEATLKEIGPKDSIEGMMAVQIAGLHEAAVQELRLAMNSCRTDESETRMNMAIKLMRTFTSHIEALNRYRGKGQQKVTVEHVTVQQGGQAIVGNVGARPEGGC